MFEIHYKSVSLKRVWHLLPGDGSEGGVAITALCLHEAFSVTGSEDGILRVWPTDFSTVFLEAGTWVMGEIMYACGTAHSVITGHVYTCVLKSTSNHDVSCNS